MKKLFVLLFAFALVAAACGGSNGENAPTGTTTAAPPTTTTAAPGTSTTTSDQSTTTMPDIDRPDLSFAVAEGWTAVSLGAGVKPVVALDSTDSPAVAWLFERVGEGFVAYAAATDDWAREAVREGYFYGRPQTPD